MLKLTQGNQQTDFAGDLSKIKEGSADLSFERDGFLFESNANFIATEIEIEEPEEPDIPLPPPNALGGPDNPPDFPVTVPMGETVVIPAGKHELPVQIVEGTLIIEDGAHIKTPGFCIMGHQGLLQIGTPDNPCADVRIELVGEHDAVKDPFAWFPGLNCGAQIKMFGTPVGPDGPLYPFPDLSQKWYTQDYRRWPQTTTGPDAWEVTTDWGETIKAGDCNLTRGITIVGGHTAILHHGKYQLDNVCFQDSQGTTIAFADNSKIYEDGSIHVGTNNQGRYGFHLHHTHYNPENFARNLVANGARRWGFVLHMSQGAVLENCLAWNVEGSGFVREGILRDGMKLINCKALGITGDLNSAALGGDAAGGSRHKRMPNGDMGHDGGRAGNGFWADNAMGVDLERFVALGVNYVGVNDNGKDWRGPSNQTIPTREFYVKGCFSPFYAITDQTYSPRPCFPREVACYADNCTNGAYLRDSVLITLKGRIDSDKEVSKRNKRQSIGVDLNHGTNGGHQILCDVRGFNHGLDLPQRNDTLKEGNEVWHEKPITVRGEYSNDVDIWGSDTVRQEIPVTHDVEIDRVDTHRPNSNRGVQAALILKPNTRNHNTDTIVKFNGETYALTADVDEEIVVP